MTTFRHRILHSLSWNFGSRFGGQLFQVAFSIILARMLSPQEFGVIGMLLVFTGFAQSLADGGLSSALIYRQDATDAHRSTVFWIQLAVGATLSVLFFCGAPLIASFYDVPILRPLSQLLSCTFFIQALGLIHNALLMKEFRFKALAVANLSSTAISGIAAVFLARAGYGVWALAWQTLSATTVLTILLWLQSGWRPRAVFDRNAAAELASYGLYLLGHTTLNYWLRNGANLLIGKSIGAHALGIFSRSYTLMLLPLNNISAVLGQVMFPALAHVQNDIPRFRRHYLTATRLIALISFPMMVGVAALSKPLILFLLGARWAEVIPILQILSFVGMFQSIVFPVGWVFTALGKTKSQFQLSILLVVIFVVSMTVGVQFGVVGVTYAYAVWTLVAGILNLHVIGHYIHSSVLTILVSVGQIALISFVMGGLVYGADIGFAYTWAYLPRLAFGSLFGVSFYVLSCIATRNETFTEFAMLVSSRLGFDLPHSRRK